MKNLLTVPKQDGFYMPAEFEKHAATYMIWPQRPDNWRGGAKFAQEVFIKAAQAISENELVIMLVSAAQYKNARARLSSEIMTVNVENDDAWARDTGATFIVNGLGGLRGIDWKFNAWGGACCGLYASWDKDDLVAGRMCEFEDADRYRADDFVLEGGSICVDGQGTAITTEACLLSAGRNPSMTKEEIEKKLKDFLNVSKVIWLKRGIYMDETSEHVDNIACFSSPANVALAWTDDKNDPQYEMSKSCFDILSAQTDAAGRKINVHKIPLPAAQFMTSAEAGGIESVKGVKTRKAGDRLAASYINHYICNGAVICPAFNDPADETAKKILENLYPQRKIIQIYSREILLGGGNIHCITQQVPKRRILPPEIRKTRSLI
ncbi:MAG: agmatine deiminase [Endomicrobium sp.]|jgi:agmatine deiminase|nr:agmatine deiminase [Endomicrobium sp.]